MVSRRTFFRRLVALSIAPLVLPKCLSWLKRKPEWDPLNRGFTFTSSASGYSAWTCNCTTGSSSATSHWAGTNCTCGPDPSGRWTKIQWTDPWKFDILKRA